MLSLTRAHSLKRVALCYDHFFEFPRWSLTRASTVVEVQGNNGMSSQLKFQFTFIYLFNYLMGITSRLYFALVLLSLTQILTSLWIELRLFKRKAWDGNFPSSPGPRWSALLKGIPEGRGLYTLKNKDENKTKRKKTARVYGLVSGRLARLQFAQTKSIRSMCIFCFLILRKRNKHGKTVTVLVESKVN